MAEEYIGINRLKEREDANKYPRKKCVRCIRYPCFSGSPDKPGGLSIQLCKSEKKEFYIRYSS